MTRHRTLAAIAAAAAALSGAAAAHAGEPPAPAEPEAIVEYRESGEWSRDTTAIVRRARAFLRERADDVAPREPGLVLDIDDTSLSSYDCLLDAGFERAGAGCGERTDLPAIPQTLSLYREARRLGVTVFFITGRRERLRDGTVENLRDAGYTGRLRVVMRPNRERRGTHDTFKQTARRRIERRGHRIVVNVGDQRSDLRGGHALRTYKLPNPMYVIP